MCNYCKGYYVRERVNYDTKEERRKHGGSWWNIEIVHKVDTFADNRGTIKNGFLCVQSETEYDGRMYDTSIKVEINYCPFCGAKLQHNDKG